ncbi:5-(carboxyamino)imidazole ribonucleotide synthase [Candidatus Cyanaurora vandensis]|uniref:5-(carboxyamino)imidazole ribonucleotide synthase n=1 Tax=Candidatus Cyanaurora vandensis TaxID=2714958 RepID=UPI00257D2330|nr:5-(carboxyamino)imidazole ribonucleotide synthase [Candidatus Cyanaurora vandensis]
MYRPRVGIVGGGQLGRMLALAGHRLGLDLILYAQADEPAAQVVPHCVENLETLAQQCDVLTFEHEWADVEALALLQTRYPIAVWPSLATLEIIQDKYQQRNHLAQAGLPVPEFAAPSDWAGVEVFACEHGPQVVLKARRQSYDGRGTQFWTLGETLPPWSPDWMVEARVPFERELAVMVARTPKGEVAVYPVVETQQVNGVCDTVLVPARVSALVATQAQKLALWAVETIQAVGDVGVELFLTAGDKLWVNELAPRPHNSGHYTLEGCQTDQFEQHLRAVLGWPLGDTDLVRSAAAMVNLLGTEREFKLWAPLDLGDVHFHWYGKAPRLGRKLGHLTVLADTVAEAWDRARLARKRWEGQG